MLVILPEIQSFGFGRDAFAGVIFESTAFFFFCDDAVFGAEDLAFVHHGAVGAVATGAGDLLSEQHGIDLSFILSTLYMDPPGKSTPFHD